MSRTEAIKSFKALDDISHVLQVPARYIGTTNEIEQDMYIFKDDKFEFQTIKYIPGLLKIIEEILDNSVDAYLNDANRTPITIKVDITKTSVNISDTGSGIPVVKYTDATGNLPELNGKYLPELAWGRLKAGGSFKENRVGAGTHGEGSSLSNIFSKVFIGKTCDGKKLCQVKCANNMREIKTTVKTPAVKKTGTEVYFEPDLERFNLKEITQIHSDLIYQRLLNLSISFPELKFFFNGKKIAINVKNFASLFSEHSLIVQSDNTLIGVFPSSTDEFQQYSFVNGLRTSKGGAHVEYVVNQIATPIKEKLEKKYKTLKLGDVKNRLGIIVFLKNFSNPQFNSQTKEVLANTPSTIAAHIDNKIDFDSFVKKILKNDAIVGPIIETFKIKEELKSRQELKKSKKVKIKSDKYMTSIGKPNWLCLCEGLSAASGISSCLGRDGIAYYAMRGLGINVIDTKIQAIANNPEFKDIINILDLDITKENDNPNIAFNKVIITSDMDADAIHITSMILGWFKRFAPNLYKEHRICKLITPLIFLTNNKNKVIKYFFDITSFKKWEEQNKDSKLNIIYVKGLGSLEKSHINQIIEEKGIEYFVQPFELDDEGNLLLVDWLGDNVEKRKQYLKEYSLDVNNV